MKVGFIGTGKITSALTQGLATCNSPPGRIVLSPRNKEKADKLASRFDSAEVAVSNQDVVDESDVVFLALRPETAEEVLPSLTFSKEQSIISLIPTYPLIQIQKWVNPATEISRAVPLPSVAKQKGPILCCFPNPVSQSLLEKLGDLVVVSNEETLHVLWAMTGMISPGFDLMETYSQWAVEKGVDGDLARDYTARFFHIIAEMARTHQGNLTELSHEAATPGGFNEQASKQIKKTGVHDLFTDALNKILQRFQRSVHG